MTKLDQTFQAQAGKPVHQKPAEFKEKFLAFKKILAEIAKNAPEKFADSSPYLCGFGTQIDQGFKKWLQVRPNSIHLRYHDKDLGERGSLAVFDIDEYAECYRINKVYEYLSAEEAISDFVKLIAPFAENRVLRELYTALNEEKAFTFKKASRGLILLEAPKAQAIIPQTLKAPSAALVE